MGESPMLFIPGPTEVDAELRQIMSMPLLGHRDPRFVATVKDVCEQLRGLFLTAQNAAFETCPGTAVMEASVRNFVPRGGSTLHLVGGAFGKRWHKISKACGRNAVALERPMGEAHTPAEVEAHLRDHPDTDAVCITHNETSTGVIQPLAELAAAVRRAAPAAMIMVDVVTSLAGAELRFDRACPKPCPRESRRLQQAESERCCAIGVVAAPKVQRGRREQHGGRGRAASAKQ